MNMKHEKKKREVNVNTNISFYLFLIFFICMIISIILILKWWDIFSPIYPWFTNRQVHVFNVTCPIYFCFKVWIKRLRIMSTLVSSVNKQNISLNPLQDSFNIFLYLTKFGMISIWISSHTYSCYMSTPWSW